MGVQNSMMQEYGYDKMNNIFMNVKFVKPEMNNGNVFHKGDLKIHSQKHKTVLNSP